MSETRIAIAIDLRLVSQILYIVWSFGDGEGGISVFGIAESKREVNWKPEGSSRFVRQPARLTQFHKTALHLQLAFPWGEGGRRKQNFAGNCHLLACWRCGRGCHPIQSGPPLSVRGMLHTYI